MYQVKTVDLPPNLATGRTLKKIINNTVPPSKQLVSITVCQGPNGLQQLVIVWE